MISLTTLLSGTGNATETATGAKPSGAGDGMFAMLVSMLRPNGPATAGEVETKTGASPVFSQAVALIDAAAAALDGADLSDTEIGDILTRLVSDLAALANSSPDLARRLVAAAVVDPTSGRARTPLEPAPEQAEVDGDPAPVAVGQGGTVVAQAAAEPIAVSRDPVAAPQVAAPTQVAPVVTTPANPAAPQSAASGTPPASITNPVTVSATPTPSAPQSQLPQAVVAVTPGAGPIPIVADAPAPQAEAAQSVTAPRVVAGLSVTNAPPPASPAPLGDVAPAATAAVDATADLIAEAPAEVPARLLAAGLPILRELLLPGSVQPQVAAQVAAVTAAAAGATPEIATAPPLKQALGALVAQVLNRAKSVAPQNERALFANPSAVFAPEGPVLQQAQAMTGPATPILSEFLPTIPGGPAAPAAQTAVAAVIPPPPPAPPPPVQPRVLLTQIRAQVGESGRIRVILSPEGLGKVEIDMVPDDDGQLRVAVRADNPAVLSVLRGERDGLAMLLRDAGHGVDDRSLSFAGFGTGSGQARQRALSPERTVTFTQAMPTEDSDEAEERPRLLSLGSGVDMEI